jgi:hypothetical protein
MVGHKLGEFSPTRQFSGHTPADKKAAQTAVVQTSAKTTTAAPSTVKPKEVKEGPNAAKK